MSQAPEAVQGDDELEPQEQQIEIDDATGETESLADSLGQSLLDDLGYVENEPQAPSSEEQGEGDEGEVTESHEPAQTTTPLTPAEQMEGWLAKVAQNPKSINEVPARHHPALVDQLVRNERELQQQAAAYAYQQGITDGAAQQQNQSRIATIVAEIDQYKKEDPTGYVEWRDAYPDRAAAYDQAKRASSPQAQADLTATAASLKAVADGIILQLNQYPEARARISAMAQADKSKFLLTPQGVAELSAAVANEIATDRLATVRTQELPAAQAVERRQAAAAKRGQIPRPPVGGPGRGSADSAEPLPDDVGQLLGMGMAEAMAGAPRTGRSNSR